MRVFPPGKQSARGALPTRRNPLHLPRRRQLDRLLIPAVGPLCAERILIEDNALQRRRELPEVEGKGVGASTEEVDSAAALVRALLPHAGKQGVGQANGMRAAQYRAR